MTDGVKITIRGKDQLLARLQELVPSTAANLAVASNQSAEEMVALAKTFVPVDTGKLRDSIHAEPGERPGSFVVKAGGAATTKEVRGGSGVPFDYSLGVEFGTSEHTNEGMFQGSDNPGARRQSFFWPAYRLMKKRLRARFTRALNKAIHGQAGVA